MPHNACVWDWIEVRRERARRRGYRWLYEERIYQSLFKTPEPPWVAVDQAKSTSSIRIPTLLAQPERAPPCEGEGCKFKSCAGCQSFVFRFRRHAHLIPVGCKNEAECTAFCGATRAPFSEAKVIRTPYRMPCSGRQKRQCALVAQLDRAPGFDPGG